MTIKEIVVGYLKQNNFEGLYHDNDCGCELKDLFPCGSPPKDCQPGIKVPCNCGEKHDWHIGPRVPSSQEALLIEHLSNAPNWICDCGQRGDAGSSEWRWNGTVWEHYHGYPIGHCAASYQPIEGKTK